MQSPPGTRAGINKIYAKVYRHHLNYHSHDYSSNEDGVKSNAECLQNVNLAVSPIVFSDI